MKPIQANEQKETHDLLGFLLHGSRSAGLSSTPHPLPPAVLQPSSADPKSVRDMLYALKVAQSAQDRVHDVAD